MKGYQVSFLAEQNRRIEHKQAMEWLLHLAKELGISGCTTFSGVESFGADGRRHSAHFFELADQPMEMVMAVTEENRPIACSRESKRWTPRSSTSRPDEYGQLGKQKNG